MNNPLDRVKRLIAREDFRANPFRAVGIRLQTKLAPKLGATEFTAVLDDDIQIRAPFTSSPGKAIRYIGVSEPETLSTIRRMLVPGGVFVDVGAHIGEYALIAVKQMGPQSRAFAFEPGREIYPYLEQSVSGSKFSNQITVFQYGVGDYDGKATFTLGVDPGHSRLASDVGGPSTLHTSGEQEVTIVRLDSFKDEFGTGPITIKIDVEGAEMGVFRGMSQLLDSTRANRPAIIFEYLERTWSVFGNSIEDLVTLLEPTGYGVYGVDGEWLTQIVKKNDADRATSGLDLDLLALLPEHIERCGFMIRDNQGRS